MPSPETDRQWQILLADDEESWRPAPSSLKARLYSAVIRQQQANGPLASLDVSVADGHDVCVFEKLVQIAPVSGAAKSPFFCTACHARVLAELLDNPPIFWAHCPYVQFKT
jgi:hypothetical protein